jgi:hypothetical protein
VINSHLHLHCLVRIRPVSIQSVRPFVVLPNEMRKPKFAVWPEEKGEIKNNPQRTWKSR